MTLTALLPLLTLGFRAALLSANSLVAPLGFIDGPCHLPARSRFAGPFAPFRNKAGHCASQEI